MNIIHELSSLTAIPEFDLFGVPPTQLTVERDVPTEYRPISTLSSSSVINFMIHNSPDEYVQLRETELYLRIKIDYTKLKGDKVAADWKSISPVNNLLHSMIKQVTLTIGNNEITTASNTYAFKAYFNTLLYASPEAKDYYLDSVLWHKDIAGEMESFSAERMKYLMNGEIDLIGKLHLDMCFQDRALMGGCKIAISITPNEPKFYLRCDSEIVPTVQIIDACLYVHKSKVTPAIVEAHNRALGMGTAKYPISRKEVKSFSIPANTLDHHINDAFNGVLPRRIYVAFVESEAFIGDFSKNPFNFQHFNLRQIVCYYDGTQYPLRPYQPDFKNQKFVREYFGLFEAANQSETHCTIDIGRSEYANGYTIFGFNFAPDLNEGPGIAGHVSPIKFGSLRIELRFEKPLPNPINVLVFSEYDSLVEINGQRIAFKNFQ